MQTSSWFKKMIAVNLAVIFFISLDRFLKVFAFNNQTSEFNLLGEILKFSYKNNYNIAFSLPLNGLFLYILLFSIVVIIVYVLIMEIINKQYITASYLTILLFGAISNILDRIIYGFVIDYLDLKWFTVFNLADIIIVFSIVCIFFHITRNKILVIKN